MGFGPSNFGRTSSDELTIGEPTTTILLTRCGYWMAADNPTFPLILYPTYRAHRIPSRSILDYESNEILNGITIALLV